MSRQIPPKYNKKQQQLQWINGLVHYHDSLCGCDGPLEHTILAITKQEKNLRFTDEEKKQLKKCIFTEDTQEEDVIGEDDLDALFAIDTGDEKDTTNADMG